MLDLLSAADIHGYGSVSIPQCNDTRLVLQWDAV